MTNVPVEPVICPLCGEANACGMTQGADTCWCTSVTIAPEVLARVPPEARDRACVCQACASGARSEAEALRMKEEAGKVRAR